MSLYNQEYNKDNVILRYILVALLADLKNEVYYYNRIDEDNYKKIEIPFYYSLTGNERFLTDNFLYDTKDNGKAKGDYEIVPRGVLQMSSMSISMENMTNKYVRSELVKEIEGELKTFNFETKFLPIDITIDATIVCSSNLELLKATESIISKLHRSTVYQVDLGMFRVEAIYKVPNDYSQEKLFEFSFDDKKEFKITFPIEVQTFMPVFQSGILLSEIDELIEKVGSGVGMIRDGKIKFGGTFNSFNTTINNIDIAPTESIKSNQPGSVNSSPTQGKIYSVDELTYTNPNTEFDKSKSWRNTNLGDK